RFLPPLAGTPAITTTPATISQTPVTTTQTVAPVNPLVHAVPPPVSPPALPPVSSHPSTPALPSATFSPPVLQSVERFGPAGHERLLIQGSLTNTAPLGTAVQLDFYASGLKKGSDPLFSSPRFLESKTVTQTTAGSFSYQVYLKADIKPGEVIAAVVHGRSGGPDWS